MTIKSIECCYCVPLMLIARRIYTSYLYCYDKQKCTPNVCAWIYYHHLTTFTRSSLVHLERTHHTIQIEATLYTVTIFIVAEKKTCWPAGTNTISLEIVYTWLFIIRYIISRRGAFVPSMLVVVYFTRDWFYTIVDSLYDWRVYQLDLIHV